jgi:hypothetical protein
VRRGIERTTNCRADVRIPRGKAVIKDVCAEGRCLREPAAKKE